jgi:rhodanese-related sulfurtransferase
VSTARTSEIGVEPQRVLGWLAENPELQLIDVREPYEREAGRIAGSRHIELTRLAAEAASLDPQRPIVLYCRVGSRSMMAAQALRSAGFEAYSMDGGLVRWTHEQHPLEPSDGYVAEH